MIGSNAGFTPILRCPPQLRLPRPPPRLASFKNHQQNKAKQDHAAELIAKGARYASIDYTDESSMVNALKGIQCVISCLSVADPQAIGVSEPALVRAAAKAGVTRFFPSQ